MLRLGTWQQVVLCDFDDRPRDREVTVTVVGECPRRNRALRQGL